MHVLSTNEPKQKSLLKGFMPFFWLALACSGGVLLADGLNLAGWVWAGGFWISVSVWILTLLLPKSLPVTHLLRHWTRADNRLPGAILVAFFFLGGWRYTAAQPVISPEHVAYHNDRGLVQMIGKVIQPPEYQDQRTNLVIQVTSLKLMEGTTAQTAPEVVQGKVLLQVQPGGDWAYGDRLGVTGQLQTPYEAGEFSYREYLARKGILSVVPYDEPIRVFIYNLRDKGYDTLQKLFPSPESDLLAGILLGRDQGLSSDLQEAFRLTGTTHIIAISGFNIAILAGLFSGIFTRILGRKWGALTALSAITAYTLLVGAEAAVVRASIIGSLGVLGGMFGRRQNGLNSLGLAGTGMVLINPNILWDVGFQLSFAATLGLVLYGQPLEERFVQLAQRYLSDKQAQKLVGPVSEFFLFTLAAQLMTLPIIAYHFGSFSWLAFLANPLILPPQPLVMILGGLTLLIGLVLPGLGWVFAIITLPFVRYTIRMVEWLAYLPGGDWVLPEFHVLWLIVFYVLLFMFTLMPKDQRSIIMGKVLSWQTCLLLLTGSVFFVWNRLLTLPDDKLHLTLLDSEGTVLIQTPGGHALLVGGGASPSHLNQVLGQMLPAADRALDVVIVGSAARDDLVGLHGPLKALPVELVLWGLEPDANVTSRTLYRLLEDQGIPRVPLVAGQSLNCGDGVLLRVLWVGERGAVLWLTYEDFSALIPTGKVEDEWLIVPESPDVLLLKDGITAEGIQLQQVNVWAPSAILFPIEVSQIPLMGEHPLIELLADYPLVTTLDHDWVRVSTDGVQMWVSGQ